MTGSARRRERQSWRNSGQLTWVQELRYVGMLHYHAATLSLHGKTQEDYNVRRAMYIELKAELI